MERIKVASLFCGCGGMDLGVIGGFSYLGNEYAENPFDIVYSIDNDKYCTKIYNENFTYKCIVKDVRDIEIDKMPEFDMLIGGFPCQSFSISAQNLVSCHQDLNNGTCRFKLYIIFYNISNISSLHVTTRELK
jgi:DNA (cytosine-5)-methyltransferase 1